MPAVEGEKALLSGPALTPAVEGEEALLSSLALTPAVEGEKELLSGPALRPEIEGEDEGPQGVYGYPTGWLYTPWQRGVSGTRPLR